VLARETVAGEELVTWEPQALVNGSACVFRVRLPADLRSLRGSWRGKTVYFGFDPRSGLWHGLAGVDVDAKPGSYPLVLEALSATGEPIRHGRAIPVGKAAYPITKLTVASKYTEPDAATLERIRAEKKRKEQVFAGLTPERLWSGPFAAPANTVTTGVFGSQRTFNGVRQSIHQGLDYRAAVGTPIHAIANGKVRLAAELFYEGGFLVLDHGQGLLSTYMHLSKFLVSEGESVRKGQLVAHSGGTGRATGPHLHLGVRWQGVYLDPAKLLALPLPE
jgi:murein DD-endopeptidase MepM/ murein hydrolase activator NlpD